MSQLPKYLMRFTRLRNDETFQRIKKKLDENGGAEKIYPVLPFRFWCHAHVFFPVFGLIFFSLIHKPNANTEFLDIALTLLTVSVGSFSFALFDAYGGVYADKHGCKAAIRLGIRLMIFMMFFFAGATVFNKRLGMVIYEPYGITAFILVWVVGQLVVGFALALIDGADTELTKKVTLGLKEQGLEQDDGDYVEGICTNLKYSGIAFTSALGCALFVLLIKWLGLSIETVGALLFLLTIPGQLYALRLLSEIPEAIEKGTYGFQLALKEIIKDRALMTWVVIIAVTEGWLLFATYYFQLDALRNLLDNSDVVSSFVFRMILLLFIPVLYGLLSLVASYGGSFFNTWHERASIRATPDDKKFLRLRHGTIVDIPNVRFQAAAYVLAIMVVVFIFHYGISAVLPQSNKPTGLSGYCLALIPLVFFGSYQYLRGFSSPLLKATLSNLTSSRKLNNRTTTLSNRNCDRSPFSCYLGHAVCHCLIDANTERSWQCSTQN